MRKIADVSQSEIDSLTSKVTQLELERKSLNSANIALKERIELLEIDDEKPFVRTSSEDKPTGSSHNISLDLARLLVDSDSGKDDFLEPTIDQLYVYMI